MRFLLTVVVATVLLVGPAYASTIKSTVPTDRITSREVVKPEKDWFESGVFYQIYPRSFKDSDGDGVGDIKGITASLEHLKDLGVTGTWLSPIFKSPMRDFGYDIADFYNVDEIFGTNEDLAELFAKAKEMEIKIILDFVPNHSSNESEWFSKSELRQDGFDDWYVWHDAKEIDADGKPIPPSNWQSVFYGSAWTWSDARNQFYLHQFDASQPDLNFRNPAVVNEMKNILKHWLDLGADGFRVDAINHLFEVEVPIDEPLTGNPDPLSYGYTDHIYTKDMPETYDMIYSWRQYLDEYQELNGGPTRIMMTEAYANHEQVSRFYGANNVEGSHMPFNFLLINDDAHNWQANRFKQEIDNWITYVPAGKVSNWVLGNHDKSRMGSRYGSDRVQGMLALEMGLPGVAVTYYGEEIGMTNNMDITWEETVDPQACNSFEEYYQNNSRDPSRTPFQWDDTINAGFSDSPDGTWLPVNKNYPTVNVKAQKEAEKSVYKFYKELMGLRKTDAFIYGSFVSRAPTDQVFMYKRSYLKEHYVYLINMGGGQQQVDIDSQYDGFSGGKVVIASTGSERVKDESVDTTAFILGPYEVVVISYNQLDEHMEWYDNAVFYQIYPRSFKDSDGDGIGDIKGIIEGLPHLKDLGVTGTWLSPIFKSPMRDFGYDIADFYNVDEMFGTNEDLKDLFAKAKELDIKIILDFVPNHSSNESEWFVKSELRQDGFDDWYVWRDAKGFDEEGNPIVPCNWLSVFYGPAWTWSPIRNQFYLHQFDTSQPDLNFRHRPVVDQMVNILWYWLDLGADGFRVDAINHMFETEEPIDEPVSGLSDDPMDHNYLDHIYTTNRDEMFEMVYYFREILDLFKAERGGNTKLLMTEAYASPENVMRFYGRADGTRTGSQMPFNFIMINDMTSTSTATEIKEIIENWVALIPEGKSTNWVLGNHDRARVGSRFGAERIEGFLALGLGLPGVAVTYYGEEIGMVNNMDISWEETVDPQACNNLEENYLEMSRDPVRTPFQWDDSEYAGFSTGGAWLPVNPNYKTLNLAAQKQADRSTYKFYKDLLQLRKQDPFTKGSLKMAAPTKDVLAYQRAVAGDADLSQYVVVINMGDQEQTVNLEELVGHEKATVMLSASTSTAKEGDVLEAKAITVQKYDTIILAKGSAMAIVVSSFLIVLSVLLNIVVLH